MPRTPKKSPKPVRMKPWTGACVVDKATGLALRTVFTDDFKPGAHRRELTTVPVIVTELPTPTTPLRSTGDDGRKLEEVRKYLDDSQWASLWEFFNWFASGKSQAQHSRVEPLGVLAEVYRRVASLDVERRRLLAILNSTPTAKGGRGK